MRKWFVCRRDGQWCAFDRDGNERFTGTEWFPVYTFARMGAEELQAPLSFRIEKYRKFLEGGGSLW